MYVCCVYPAISKNPTQLPNYLKITDTTVLLVEITDEEKKDKTRSTMPTVIK
jgi:hypothetical protein